MNKKNPKKMRIREIQTYEYCRKFFKKIPVVKLLTLGTAMAKLGKGEEHFKRKKEKVHLCE